MAIFDLILILFLSSAFVANGQGPKLTGRAITGRFFAGLEPPILSTNAYKGHSISISCSFESNSLVEVSWYKDGVISSRRRKDTEAPIGSNISKHLLFLDRLRVSDAGTYKCTGKSGNITGDSGLFQLNVIGESMPKFRDNFPPSRLVLYAGQTFDLQCDVSNYHTVEYAWGRESGYIDFNVFIMKQKTLRFQPAIPKNSGNYTCKAKNKIGTALKTVNVVVVDNPSWREKPKTINVAIGKPFQLAASFYGSVSGLQISWLKNGLVVTKSAEWRKVEGENTGSYVVTTYKVPEARIQDAGSYSLKIININDKISAEADVFVISKPNVVIESGRQLVASVGQTVQLACEVDGYPSPSIKWESDGRVLATNRINSGTTSHKIRSTLVLFTPPVTNDKIYNCTAENQYGRDQEFIKVIVRGGLTTTVKPKELNKPPPTSQEGTEISQIAIPVAAGVIVLLIIFIAIYIVRRKEKPSDIESGAVYCRAVESISDRGDDEQLELIPEPAYMMPSAEAAFRAVTREFSSKKGQERTMSIKRQNLTSGSMRYANAEQKYIYAEILPVGQGKHLRFEDMNLGEICGSGNFGVVVKGTLDEEGGTSKEIAVKMLKDTAGLTERKMMLDELQMMKALSPHPNVIGLLGWCITNDNVFIVEEYIPNGSLLHYLRSKRKNFYSHYVNLRQVTQSKCDVEFILFAWQIASGMKYLSSQSVVHRDLATRNILLGHENVCKIADFGLARAVYQNANYKKTGGGQLPVRWMAPESLFNSVYSKATDVWSFGIVLWEIATLGDIPYPDLPTVEHLLTMLRKKQRMVKPSHCAENLYRLMTSCWEEMPGERPEFDVITLKLGKMVNDDAVYLDIPRFFENLDKEIHDEEDVFDANEEQIPSDSSATI